ncbi:MAG TPA: D-arabinono-1,4-lactone oxidase, partial [Microlunatus sp.]
MSKLLSYLRGGLATTANVAAYAASDGRFVLLEGRRCGATFHNWALRYRQRPLRIAQPTTEAEIIELIRSHRRLRVVGSGHSFNPGIVTEEVLISLDAYSGAVSVDPVARQVSVRAGTRVRDVVALMLEHGLAFTALPSHDAQSIGGILSTDVHGTGRSWGFVSESIVELTIIDGTGAVHRCGPADPLFRAAIGGIGAVGIITEVTIQGVPRFTIEQRTEMQRLDTVRLGLDSLIEDHDHVSLYVFPYADHCQVNTWDRSNEPASRADELQEFINISADALLAAWAGNLLAYTGIMRLGRHWSRLAFLIKRGTRLVLESDNAHNRTIYHLHQELEFTIPFERTFEICDRLLSLYERMSATDRLPYLLLEVRFTPAGHDRTLIGPGKERRCTWIDLIVNDSDGFEQFYTAARQVITEIGGRPHLGKYTDGIDGTYLERLYGDDYRTFQALAAAHDPEAKLSNAFTRRMLNQHSV